MVLEHWALVRRSNDDRLAVFGYIYGHHPRQDARTGEFAEGHRIVTSPIVTNINGPCTSFVTESGSTYALGTPHPRYPQWQTTADPVSEEEAYAWPRKEPR